MKLRRRIRIIKIDFLAKNCKKGAFVWGVGKYVYVWYVVITYENVKKTITVVP